MSAAVLTWHMPGRVVYAEAGYLYPSEIEPLHSGGPAMAGAPPPLA